MRFIKIGKDVMKATLVCLMLSCILSGTSRTTLKAEPSYFTIEACVTNDPYWGYYGGYHDIWNLIQIELAKINITLTIEYNTDPYIWWEKVWGTGWNHTGDETGANAGWDVTMFEWWLQPHAVEPWFGSMVLADMTPLEGGFNIHPWMNTYASELVLKGLQSFDAATRKHYLWGWQEEWMHDPPIAEIYYPRIYEAMASYVLGYDSSGCWWYDAKHLDINVTEFELTVGPGGSDPNPTRYAAGNDTLFYAVSEDVWGWSPMYMDSYTEENFGVLCYDTLYTWSLNWTDAEWLKAGIVEPDYWDYIIKPELASGPPIDLYGNGTHMRVPLRTDVLWSDQDLTHPRAGQPFNATDVKFTYDLALDVDLEPTGYGDFAYLIESVEVVPLAEGLGGKWCPYTDQFINASAVDFILKFPHPDFTSVISNDWGGGSIIPWSQDFENAVNAHPSPPLDAHKTNTGWAGMHPGTGPYIVTEESVPGGYIKLERNDLHWGYGLGYGPHVSTIYLKFVPDAGDRKLALENNEIDLGEYPFATVAEFTAYKTWDNLRVIEYDYPASNGVWFNFNNEYLSNRYVRQAFAHAIPYGDIASIILPQWGVKSTIQGKTHILPMHYYEGEHLFNTALPPYEYDLAKAAAYLKMWLYAQPAYAPYGSPQVAQGPVGDANFDGVVNFDDFFVYAEWRGSTSAEWTWDPGCDIDPDFDNSGGVSYPFDFDQWFNNYRNEYPFDGAR
jgi:ABC-type transport system substrate-binding protein